jgi:hypothetical protein
MEQRESVSAFGQADPTDDRAKYDWKSKYDDPVAKQGILREALYLGALLVLFPAVMVIFWLGYPKTLLHLSDEQYRPLMKYVFAWAAGSLGGVLFDIKWLYHVVARGLWHLDRRLWRIFTPHISGGLSFFFLALVASGGLRIFDGRATNSLSLVIGLGFLVGYFSDSAFAKLTEVAETLFGTIRAKEKHSGTSSDATPKKRDESKPAANP